MEVNPVKTIRYINIVAFLLFATGLLVSFGESCLWFLRLKVTTDYLINAIISYLYFVLFISALSLIAPLIRAHLLKKLKTKRTLFLILLPNFTSLIFVCFNIFASSLQKMQIYTLLKISVINNRFLSGMHNVKNGYVFFLIANLLFVATSIALILVALEKNKQRT